jgi:hydrogenase/urease accessory protein HupE
MGGLAGLSHLLFGLDTLFMLMAIGNYYKLRYWNTRNASWVRST